MNTISSGSTVEEVHRFFDKELERAPTNFTTAMAERICDIYPAWEHGAPSAPGHYWVRSIFGETMTYFHSGHPEDEYECSREIPMLAHMPIPLPYAPFTALTDKQIELKEIENSLSELDKNSDICARFAALHQQIIPDPSPLLQHLPLSNRALEILYGRESPVDWRDPDQPELLRALSEHLENLRQLGLRPSNSIPQRTEWKKGAPSVAGWYYLGYAVVDDVKGVSHQLVKNPSECVCEWHMEAPAIPTLPKPDPAAEEASEIEAALEVLDCMLAGTEPGSTIAKDAEPSRTYLRKRLAALQPPLTAKTPVHCENCVDSYRKAFDNDMLECSRHSRGWKDCLGTDFRDKKNDQQIY